MVMKKNDTAKREQTKERKEWSHEWGLEKQTEGLDKKAVAEQTKIGKNLEQKTHKHGNGCGCK